MRSNTDSELDAARSERARLVPFALLSTAALGLEVLLTRFLAYSVAAMLIYVVLGIALVGFGAAGTLATLFADRLARRSIEERLAWASLAFSIATVACTALFVRLTPLVTGFGFVTFAVASLLMLPFLAAGLVVALALASARHVGVCYAANLGGSALGCLLPLVLLRALGGERMIALFAALGWIAAWWFSRAAPTAAPKRLGLSIWASLALVLGSVALAPWLYAPEPEPAPLGQLRLVREVAKRFKIRERQLYDRWNATGRIQIFGYDVPGVPPPYPFLFYAQDSSAGSCLARWDGKPAGAGGGGEVARACSETLWAQAYFAPRRKVLAIGLGGGMDVQCALYNGAAAVDVVEINPDSIAAVRGRFDAWTGGIGSDPRVSYHVADGRSFVNRASGAGYDVIQLSGVDTKNSTSSGGLALSENTLYTAEAFRDYLENLSDSGVLSIVRFTDPEAVRLSATAAQALRARGAARPEQHILVLENTYVRGVVVRKTPFLPEEIRALEQKFVPTPGRPYGVAIFFYEAMGMDFKLPPKLLHAPGRPGRGDVGAYFAALAAGQEPQFLAAYAFDAKPTTDDRPFFFDWFRYRDATVLFYPHVLVIGSVLFSVLVLAAGSLVLPFLFSKRRLRGASFALGLYFGCIGLAYLLVEIWLIHRFAMFLGHQTYALGVVLSALLLGSGAGAALGERTRLPPRRRLVAAVVAIGCMLALGTLLLPKLLSAAAGAGLLARGLIAVAYLAPLGFFMGWPFPAGLALARARAPATLPFYVGINGFASVVATLAIVPLSHAYGYLAVMAIGGALYLLACTAALVSKPSGNGAR